MSSFPPESRPPTVHVVYLTRWNGCFQAPIPQKIPHGIHSSNDNPEAAEVPKMWIWGSLLLEHFCPIHMALSLMNDDLLDGDHYPRSLFSNHGLLICMLNDWVTSCFPWRAGLWDLFRCLKLSLESGDPNRESNLTDVGRTSGLN